MYDFFRRQLKKQGFEVRKIELSELEELRKVAISTFIETYKTSIEREGGLEKVQEKIHGLFSPSELNQWLSNPNQICLGLYQAEPSNQLCGFSLLKIEDNDAFLHKLYLLESAKGLGLGRIMIEANYSELRQRPAVKTLKLEVGEANTEAQRFYKKMGFRDTLIRKLYSASSTENPYYDLEYLATKQPSNAITLPQYEEKSI
jgi:ribosomal protein S18 acetylase RimI-like enzyme